MIRVLVADDHPLMREIISVRVALAGVKVVAEAANGEEALRHVRILKPELAVIDLDMPGMDGLEIVRLIVETGAATRCLLYSGESKTAVIKQAIAIGASGYLSKTADQDMLASAIESVLAGRTFIDPNIAGSLFDPVRFDLTARELQVLTLMTEGFQNKVIAVRLAISEDTIKTHVSSVMTKFGVTSRTGAVAMALRERIVA